MERCDENTSSISREDRRRLPLPVSIAGNRGRDRSGERDEEDSCGVFAINDNDGCDNDDDDDVINPLSVSTVGIDSSFFIRSCIRSFLLVNTLSAAAACSCECSSARRIWACAER